MAASFPTALQRTSDERWVTLDVVAREHDRALARIVEAPSQAAVVRLERGLAYDRHLRQLLSTPPPDPGDAVHVSWPVDLLHDLDARAIGYASTRPSVAHTFPLADFVDPNRRAQIAPMATRRHLLRVARNVATATAALHHSGYARIRGRQFRLDDRARIVVVRTDELLPDPSAVQKADDRRRLGFLAVRLLGGRPWASDGDLADLIRRAGDPTLPAAPADEWFFALRQAERSLPRTQSVAAVPAEPERVLIGTDLATALRQARGEPSPGGSSPAPAQPAPPRVVRAATPAQSAPTPAPSAAPTPAPTPARTAAPVSAARGRRRRRATHVDGRHTVEAMRRLRQAPSEDRVTTVAARRAFGLAAGLTVGGLASVAPFATFLAVVCLMILRAAIRVGLRRSTMGPLQTMAITLTRLVPFATGGLAFAAFILLDLLLILGVCMALAERLFDYGPGFTLNWILQLPEVPGLVRAFALAIGAVAGVVLGGQAYDRIRRDAGSRRMIATPAIAMALAMGTLAVDASITWWPLPLLT